MFNLVSIVKFEVNSLGITYEKINPEEILFNKN